MSPYHLRAPHTPLTALWTSSPPPPCCRGFCPDAILMPVFCNCGHSRLWIMWTEENKTFSYTAQSHRYAPPISTDNKKKKYRRAVRASRSIVLHQLFSSKLSSRNKNWGQDRTPPPPREKRLHTILGSTPWWCHWTLFVSCCQATANCVTVVFVEPDKRFCLSNLHLA